MMPVIIDTRVPRHTGLNRTFYGIETQFSIDDVKIACVLIVPFMELKLTSSTVAMVPFRS